MNFIIYYLAISYVINKSVSPSYHLSSDRSIKIGMGQIEQLILYAKEEKDGIDVYSSEMVDGSWMRYIEKDGIDVYSSEMVDDGWMRYI